MAARRGGFFSWNKFLVLAFNWRGPGSVSLASSLCPGRHKVLFRGVFSSQMPGRTLAKLERVETWQKCTVRQSLPQWTTFRRQNPRWMRARNCTQIFLCFLWAVWTRPFTTVCICACAFQCGCGISRCHQCSESFLPLFQDKTHTDTDWVVLWFVNFLQLSAQFPCW